MNTTDTTLAGAAPRRSGSAAAARTAVPRVGSVMHGPVVAVDARDSLWTAMDVMLTRGLRHLVVTDAGLARGILSDRDLAAVWAMDPIGLKNRRAEHLVAADRTFPGAGRFVDPETDVVTAAARMRELGADALIVVDAVRKPVGVVTDHALLGVLTGLLRDAD